jgi:hypothetical protein
MSDVKSVTVLSNREDIYLDDPEKQAKVGEWMRDCLTVAEAKGALGVPGLSDDVKAETFADAFPEDYYVQEWRDKQSAQSKNKLLFHIAVIETRLPVASAFALHGLTTEKLLRRLADHVDSDKAETSLKAIEISLKYIYPTLLPARVKNVQNNSINLVNDPRKKEVIERILNKIGSNSSSSGS